MKKVAVGLITIAIAMQLIPVRRTNPSEKAPLDAPVAVAAVLQRSCYDCHSNKTNWPWYSKVAPVSWWLVSHVDEGREHLNFSDWGILSEKDRVEAMEEILEEVDEKSMPLPSYLKGHPEAALSDQDLAVLRAWIDSSVGETDSGSGSDNDDHED